MVNLHNNRSSSNLAPEDSQTSLVEAWVAANASPGVRISNSPVNGFTSEECANILEQELDNLSGENSPSCKISQQKQGISSASEVEMKALANSRSWKDKWTILDCCFGVPLFDAETNSEICEAIVAMKLWKKENMEKLTTSSRRLCLRLLDFIAHHQVNKFYYYLVNATMSNVLASRSKVRVFIPG